MTTPLFPTRTVISFKLECNSWLEQTNIKAYLGAHRAVVLFVVIVLHKGLHVDEAHVLGVRDDPVRQQGLRG